MTTVLTEVPTADAMVKIAREQIDAFNTGDWERLRAGLASDSRYDELGTQRTIEGPDRIVDLFKGWKQAFPDAVGTVTSAVASGDKAALEVVWKGTHTGPLTTAAGTIPASGKTQVTPAGYFLTFAGDKIKEGHHYFDSLTLLEQIGAQPN
ncbi:MAG: ester cyclase [Actinobacteria bacterium]|nr:MAG: ester cyclase [Actinomycetota bacterium]